MSEQTEQPVVLDPLKLVENAVEIMGGIIPSLLLQGEFSEEEWDRIMGDETLGPVYPSAPIAAKLVRDIKGRIDEIYTANSPVQ